MQLRFNSICETTADVKWQQLFRERWPVYKVWLNSNVSERATDLKTSYQALKEYMPEMFDMHQNLCHLVNANEEAARFLTGFQPPAYYSACSQAVSTKDSIHLIRNYDYYPNQIEGTVLLSAWNGKKVIVSSDCLIGALDGMNEDGLAVSLTFGGRKEVGYGFGIPFILRYVLEFCSDVNEAVEALIRVPSHMSYNVTVIDRSGNFKTLQLAPDRSPLVTDDAFATNHQNDVDWPENAVFNKTYKRESFLMKTLLDNDVNGETLIDAFLHPPLYNTHFSEGLGTLYTAVYSPREGTVQIRWPNEIMRLNFKDFFEESILIKYDQRPSHIKQEKHKSQQL